MLLFLMYHKKTDKFVTVINREYYKSIVFFIIVMIVGFILL